MKKLLLVFLALFAFAAQAQIVPSIPYTLTNGSLADATQVMGNFNTIVTDVNANAATNGANTNITAITGLTTPLANTYGGTVIYTGGTTGGSANAQTLATVVPSNYANTAGNIVTGVAGFTNTTSPTLAVNAQTAKQTAVNTPLGLISTPANTLVSGQGFLAMFDGTYFEILSAPPNSVANSQLALMSNNTFKGNISGGNAVPSDLSLASTQQTINAFLTIKPQAITTTATYTPCTGLIYSDFKVIGGGGGGGGVGTTSNSTSSGGSAGAFSEGVFSAATIIAAEPITATVGAGGTAGANTGGNGGTGGTSSVGALISAVGGNPGVGSNSGTISYGPAGATGTVFGASITGAPGGSGIMGTSSANLVGGVGGNTWLGGGAVAPNTSGGATNGNNGSTNTGGGGSGTSEVASASGKTGGIGGTGIILITDYCNQ